MVIRIIRRASPVKPAEMDRKAEMRQDSKQSIADLKGA